VKKKKLVITLQKVKKNFPELPSPVLNGIDLEIRKGDRVVLTGKSGSGKTTLLNILTLVDHPTEGKVFWCGDPYPAPTSTRALDMRRLFFGTLYQNPVFIDEMTVLENVALVPRLKGVSKKEARDKARAILSEVGLEERCLVFPYMLSGGEASRAALARALVGEPPFLFADEPTGNLDSETQKNIMELLSSHLERTGAALFLVTHNKNLLQFFTIWYDLREGNLIPKTT